MNKRQLKRIIREETKKQLSEIDIDYGTHDEFAIKVSQTQQRMKMTDVYVSKLNDTRFAFMIENSKPKFRIKPFESQMNVEVTVVSIAADGSLYIGGNFR